MRVHDATSIEATDGTNGENRKKATFLRICSLFYTILGIGIIRWGDQCFTKITILLRLIQVYSFYIIISVSFEILIRISGAPENSYPMYFACLTQAVATLSLYLLLLQGFFRKNNIERHADDIDKIDKLFPELSLAHRSNVHCYMHILGLVIIGLMIFSLKITHFLGGERKILTINILWAKSLIFISMTLLYNCVYDVNQRFKRINELCTDMGNQVVEPLEKIRLIRKLKVLHIQLSKRVLEIVRVHGITVALAVIRIFTVFTVDLMSCIRYTIDVPHLEMILFSSILEIIVFVLLCMVCTNATTEANGTIHYIYGMALKDPTFGLRLEVLNFVSYLRVQKVQFNLYGFVEINNRLMVFITTALITHVSFFLDMDGL